MSSLVKEARKRIQQGEPLLPILRTAQTTQKTEEIREPPPEVPAEYRVTYTPPHRR